jgi:hypothetical protein
MSMAAAQIETVIPAKAGISAQKRHGTSPRDPGIRRGDGLGEPS